MEKNEKIREIVLFITLFVALALMFTGSGGGVLAGIIIFVVAAISYFYMERRDKKHQAMEEEQKRKEKFFYECRANRVYEVTTPANRQKAQLIAQKYGFNNINIDQFFAEMKDVCEEKDRQKKLIKLQELATNEQQKYKELTRYAGFTGRDKRIKMLLDEVNELRTKLGKSQEDYKILLSAGQQKEINWATHGGIASAIAGGAAGVAVAVDAQARNEEIRGRNKAYADALSYLHFNAKEKYEEKLRSKEQALSRAKIKLVDNTPKEEAFTHLKFYHHEETISETGACSIKVTLGVEESIKIFDNVPAVVDGVVCANIYQNGALVGVALLVLPLYGVNENGGRMLSCPGIDNKVTVEGLSLCKARADLPCEITFTPHNLWLMEL